MIVNASRIVRYLTAIGTPDPWGAYDRASVVQLTVWAEAAQEWERNT